MISLLNTDEYNILELLYIPESIILDNSTENDENTVVNVDIKFTDPQDPLVRTNFFDKKEHTQYSLINGKYIIKNNNGKNKDFMFCCDLLKLKEYDEFEKKIKNIFWNMDNCYIIMDCIKDNNTKHFKYISKFINIANPEQLLIYCCKNNYINIVYILIDTYDLKHIQLYVEQSMLGGSIKMFNKYLDMMKLSKELFNNTIISGNIDNLKILEKLHKKKGSLLNYKYPYDNDIVEVAIKSENIKMITLFLNKNFLLDTKIFLSAITTDNPKILDFVYSYEEKLDLVDNTCMTHAIKNKKYNSIKWLLNKNIDYQVGTIEIAAINKDFIFMKQLIKKYGIQKSEDHRIIGSDDKIDIILYHCLETEEMAKYFIELLKNHKSIIEIPYNIYDIAIYNNAFYKVKRLFSYNVEFSLRIFDTALPYCTLEQLKWLITNKCCISRGSYTWGHRYYNELNEHIKNEKIRWKIERNKKNGSQFLHKKLYFDTEEYMQQTYLSDMYE